MIRPAVLALAACGARRAPPEPLPAAPLAVALDAGALEVRAAGSGPLEVLGVDCTVAVAGGGEAPCPAVEAAPLGPGAALRVELPAGAVAASGTVRWRRPPGGERRTVFSLVAAGPAAEEDPP